MFRRGFLGNKISLSLIMEWKGKIVKLKYLLFFWNLWTYLMHLKDFYEFLKKSCIYSIFLYFLFQSKLLKFERIKICKKMNKSKILQGTLSF